MARTKFNVDKDKSKRTYNGIVFDSVLEMKYYRDVICPKVESGDITDVKLQVKYELQPKFIHDNKTVQAINYVADSSTKTFTSVPLPDERPTICNCKINYKDCTVDISHGNYVEIIQREDMKTGEIKTLVSGTLLAQDWFAASNKTYRYHVVSIVEQDNEYKYTTERITNTVTPEWDCWSITALLPAEDESGFSECDGEIYRTDYTYGTWRLFVEPEMDDVVQNMSPTVHETIHALPKVTSSEANYISGGITCGLGQIECSDKTFIDDIYKVEAWRKFITQKCVYLLKSPKGDVWVVKSAVIQHLSMKGIQKA